MQEWIDQNFALFFPVFFAGAWLLSTYWVAFASGWRLLARKFRTQGAFTGEKWKMQSVRMRWGSHYNNAVTVGADNTGLFISMFILFRPWHPPLFVPWSEISVSRRTYLFFFKMIELRLGRSEEVPFRIWPKFAARIEAAAGTAWPERQSALFMQPPPIG